MSAELIGKTKAAVIEGDENAVVIAARQALEAGVDAFSILQEGLMAGADQVGKKFETGEIFLPRLMLAGNALNAAMEIIEPTLKEEYASGKAQRDDTGTVVIATVKSDIHDIGKNIVSSMLSSSGFDVHDLGVDVPIKEIIKNAQSVNADIIACSALLTTSLPFMRDLIDLLEVMGERARFKVMFGGASVTQKFVDEAGADGTADHAMKAVQLAKKLIRERKQEGANQ